MNEIQLTTLQLPILQDIDFLVAPEPFIHANRVADFHVVIYVTEGLITVTEDEVDYEIHPGELLFLKRGVHHYGKKTIAQGTSWYYIHFQLEEISISTFTPPQNTSVAETLLPKKIITTGHDLESALKELLMHYHSKNAYYLWKLNKYLYEFLTDCAFYSSQKRELSVSLAERIAEYLHTHIAQPFNANELEHVFYLSYKHMATVFKKEKAQTMQQYHTSLRMNEACRLLRSTLLSIGAISNQLGYRDMLYFSRCFHQVIGMSPTDYRKKILLQF